MLWKIYFWLLAAVFIIGEGAELKHATLWIFVDIIITIIGLTMLYGYVFKRRLIGVAISKLFFPFLLFWEVIVGFAHALATHSITFIVVTIFGFLISKAVLLPYYIGVYRYAYIDSNLSDTQLNFRREMKGVKKQPSPYDNSRDGNPFNRDNKQESFP